MSEPDEKEHADLWLGRGRCAGCNGYAVWNKSAGLWEPCECREDGDEEEGDGGDD
jgi:hypothetical protein